MTFSVKKLKDNEILKYDSNLKHIKKFLNIINIQFMLQLNEYILNCNKMLIIFEHLKGQITI